MPPRRWFQGFALSVAVGALTIPVPFPAARAQTPAPPAQNVLDTMKSTGDLTTFLKAIEHAGLEATLTGPGPITVFAPADAVFQGVPKETIDAAMANKERLIAVLKNHIVEGQSITLEQLKAETVLKTAAGQQLEIKIQDGVPVITDAKVLRGDIAASNGVIHVVNAVLIPKLALFMPKD